MNKIYDVIIIGAGPAGISAAIQLKRYGINFLILEKNGIGGLLKNASLVENYPGFSKGITGYKLINLFKKHLSELGIKTKKEKVLNIDHKQKQYSVNTNKAIYNSKFLVIASGTKTKTFVTRGSSEVKIYCNVYELFNVRNKEIVLIGGGDAAFDYAVSLGRNGNSVSIIHRSSKPNCIPALLNKVSQIKNIYYLCNLSVLRIYKEKRKIIIDCGKNKILTADYVIAAIGREPQIDFIEKRKMKVIKRLDGRTLFFIGDVKNEIFRQATISIGDGILAAMKISQKLREANESNSKN